MPAGPATRPWAAPAPPTGAVMLRNDTSQMELISSPMLGGCRADCCSRWLRLPSAERSPMGGRCVATEILRRLIITAARPQAPWWMHETPEIELLCNYCVGRTRDPRVSIRNYATRSQGQEATNFSERLEWLPVCAGAGGEYSHLAASRTSPACGIWSGRFTVDAVFGTAPSQERGPARATAQALDLRIYRWRIVHSPPGPPRPPPRANGGRGQLGPRRAPIHLPYTCASRCLGCSGQVKYNTFQFLSNTKPHRQSVQSRGGRGSGAAQQMAAAQ